MKTALKLISVGLLFFSGLGFLIYITVLTKGSHFKKETIIMKVYFNSADGIKIGNKVTLQGVPFGYVSRINLVDIDKEGNILTQGQSGGIASKVELILTLNKKIYLYPNYKITLKNESLLSGRVIAINPGFPEAQKNILVNQKKTIEIPIQGTTLKDPLETLAELIAENRSDIRQIIINVKEITQKTNEGKGTLGKLLNSNELHDNVNSTVGDVQIMVNDLREGLEDTREQAPVSSFIRAALSAF